MCKSIFTFKMVFIFLFTFIGISQAQYSGGSGTAEDPYKISVAADWETLTNTPGDWDKHFILTADLDLKDVALSPVGNNNRRFTGVLDGNGHAIRNAVIEQPNNDYVGLFGYLGEGAQIHDIIVENAEIKGRSYTGGLVGFSEKASITACSAAGQVSGWDYVGGMMGASYEGPVNDCHATGSAGGRESIGGLVGHTQNSTLLGCSATGPVTGTGPNSGGLVGQNDQSNLTTCSASGSVTTDYDYAGGLVGYNYKGLFTSCSATGQVSGRNYIGGLVGANDEAHLNDCHATGSAGGRESVGGLVGYTQNSTLLGCSATGPVIGTASNIGGLVGYNNQGSLTTCSASGSITASYDDAGGLVGYSEKALFTACYASGQVSGRDYVGGLVGANYEGPMNDCYATGSARGRTYIGGLVGHTQNSELLGCSAIGPVTGTGSYIGGLVGRNDQSSLTACSASGKVTADYECAGGLVGISIKADVTKCSASGEVYGQDYIGGLMGASYESPMNDCYATGSVDGRTYVGGLVGNTDKSRLSACYSGGGRVQGTGEVGGLVGYDSGSVEPILNFWDIETSGQTTSALGTGKKTDEMQDPNTFIAAGWDFLDESENGIAETWTIRDVNYPELCWQVYYRIAYAPNPPDGAGDVDPNVTLSWIPSITAGCHDVYFSEDFNDVNDGLTEALWDCRTEPNFTVGLHDCPYPDGLVPWATYYWRIDEVNDADPNSPWKGRVWSFTVPQKKAYNPYPADGDEEVDPNVILTWAAGFNAQSHTVYFSEDINDVINRIDGVVLEPNSYVPGILAARTTYYWRVDEFDGYRIHKDDVWSFTVCPYTEICRCQVLASEDDGYASSNQLDNLNADYLKVGLNSFAGPPYYMSGMLFRDVKVPQAAKIVSAQLKILSHDDRLTAEVFGKIQAEGTDNAVPFDSKHSIADRSRTSASVIWDHHESWSPDTWYESPDIADVIQEVIDREGWSAGNSLVIFYCTREHKGGYRQFSSYDRGANSAPKLEITYEP